MTEAISRIEARIRELDALVGPAPAPPPQKYLLSANPKGSKDEFVAHLGSKTNLPISTSPGALPSTGSSPVGGGILAPRVVETQVVRGDVSAEAIPVDPDERKRREKYLPFIREASALTGVPEALISAVMQAESSYKPETRSSAGAMGLMQLMPENVKEFGVTDAYDPQQNILAGARHLRQMIDRFGTLDKALAGYNAGPGNVIRHGGVPPFTETQNYVRRITDMLRKAGALPESGPMTPVVNLPSSTAPVSPGTPGAATSRAESFGALLKNPDSRESVASTERVGRIEKADKSDRPRRADETETKSATAEIAPAPVVPVPTTPPVTAPPVADAKASSGDERESHPAEAIGSASPAPTPTPAPTALPTGLPDTAGDADALGTGDTTAPEATRAAEAKPAPSPSPSPSASPAPQATPAPEATPGAVPEVRSVAPTNAARASSPAEATPSPVAPSPLPTASPDPSATTAETASAPREAAPAERERRPLSGVRLPADAPGAEPTPLGIGGPQPTAKPTPTTEATPTPAPTATPDPETVSQAELTQRFAQLAQATRPGGKSELHVRLDPANLGHVRVSVEGGADGVAIRVVAESRETMLMLQDQRGSLHEALRQSEVALGSFSASMADTGGGAQGQNAFAPPTRFALGRSVPRIEEPTAVASSASILRPLSLDTRA